MNAQWNEYTPETQLSADLYHVRGIDSAGSAFEYSNMFLHGDEFHRTYASDSVPARIPKQDVTHTCFSMTIDQQMQMLEKSA